jgi:lipopolysaccharide export system permease protein
MRLLQRQIFKETGTLFAICVTGFLSLILIGRMLQMRELFMSQGLSLLDLGRLFVFLSPFFLLLILPVACMLSQFLTFLRMGSDREITALKAGGIGISRCLQGPVLFCSLISLVTLGVSLYGVSWGTSNFRATLLELARTKAELVLQPGVFNNDFPGLTIFARNVDPASGDLQGVFVEDATRKKANAVIVAPVGRVVTDQNRGEMLFDLKGGHIYRDRGGETTVIGFDTYRLRMDLSKLLGEASLGDKRPKEMSPAELDRLEQEYEAGLEKDERYRKVIQEKAKRYALPLACLVLGLFAIPLAFIFQGVKRQYGLILALGFFLLYYVLLSMGLSLGETGVLPPRLGVWLPNILFSAFTVLGFRVAARERSFSFPFFKKPKT